MTPFGVLWDELDLQAITKFLDGAARDEEGITWEAKGDDRRGELRPATVEDAVAGMANGFYVGYLIIGAGWDKSTNRWQLSGLSRPRAPELANWLDQVVDGIQPRPVVDIKALACEHGPGAVIRIRPVPVPPVVKSIGRLLIRTSSRTVPVTDPGEVRRLFERGERRLEHARNDAADAANLSRTMPFDSRYSPSMTIGLAATGQGSDVNRAIFRRSFTDWLREAYLDWDPRAVRKHLQSRMPPDRVYFWTEADHGSQVGATASGAVFITYWSAADRDRGLALAIDGMLARTWPFVGRISEQLGGHGPTFAFAQLGYVGGAVADLRWRTDRPAPSEPEIGAAIRYLKRLRGDRAIFEPEDSSGSGEPW